jgi:hypothetical protein
LLLTESCNGLRNRGLRNAHGTPGLTALEHDPEKWEPVSEKIMLHQKVRAGWRFEETSSRSRSFNAIC